MTRHRTRVVGGRYCPKDGHARGQLCGCWTSESRWTWLCECGEVGPEFDRKSSALNDAEAHEMG